MIPHAHYLAEMMGTLVWPARGAKQINLSNPRGLIVRWSTRLGQCGFITADMVPVCFDNLPHCWPLPGYMPPHSRLGCLWRYKERGRNILTATTSISPPVLILSCFQTLSLCVPHLRVWLTFHFPWRHYSNVKSCILRFKQSNFHKIKWYVQEVKRDVDDSVRSFQNFKMHHKFQSFLNPDCLQLNVTDLL